MLSALRASGFRSCGLAMLSFGLCASIGSAQSISDGNSTFNLPAADTTGAAIRTGVGNAGATFTAGGDTTDQLFQQWWWYRVDGVNSREFALSNRTSNVAAGNTLTLEFTEPEGFTARVVYRLTDGPDTPASANVAIDVTISNTGGAPLSIALFGYLDFDLEGVTGDSATLLEPGRIEAVDATGFRGQFLGVASDAFQVLAFGTAAPAIRSILADADIDNLNNSGLPFAAADFTAAQQWNLTIGPGASRTVRAAIALNQTAMATPAGPACPADFNGQGGVGVQDIFDFLTAWFSNSPSADFNGQGGIGVQDIFDFLTAWFTGCP